MIALACSAEAGFLVRKTSGLSRTSSVKLLSSASSGIALSCAISKAMYGPRYREEREREVKKGRGERCGEEQGGVVR